MQDRCGKRLTTYEGQLTIFRYLDNAGKAVQDDFCFRSFSRRRHACTVERGS